MPDSLLRSPVCSRKNGERQYFYFCSRHLAAVPQSARADHIIGAPHRAPISLTVFCSPALECEPRHQQHEQQHRCAAVRRPLSMNVSNRHIRRQSLRPFVVPFLVLMVRASYSFSLIGSQVMKPKVLLGVGAAIVAAMASGAAQAQGSGTPAYRACVNETAYEFAYYNYTFGIVGSLSAVLASASSYCAGSTRLSKK